MNWTFPTMFLSFFVFCKCIANVCSQPKRGQEIGCQHRFTKGHDYVGKANTTVDGIPCQRWSDKQPHDHRYTHVGDHNFCRNPDGSLQSKVFCFTTDPKNRYQHCSVPFCPPLKALDFSLDNDWKLDESKSSTHASLQKENLPPSFTICTAFMVEAWSQDNDAWLFFLRDDIWDAWLFVGIGAMTTYSEFPGQQQI